MKEEEQISMLENVGDNLRASYHNLISQSNALMQNSLELTFNLYNMFTPDKSKCSEHYV